MNKMEFINKVFFAILNVSITITIVAVGIIMIRNTILKRAPKIFCYLLWVGLVFRMISPMSFSSNLSIFNFFESYSNNQTWIVISSNLEGEVVEDNGFSNTTEQGTGKTNNITENSKTNVETTNVDTTNVETTNVDTTNTELTNELSSVVVTKPDSFNINQLVQDRSQQAIQVNQPETSSKYPITKESIQGVFSMTWLMVTCCFILYGLGILMRMKNQLKTATLLRGLSIDQAQLLVGIKRKVKVFVTDQISSPLVIGILFPAIYLPKDIDKNEMHYILVHEFVHIKRLDHIVKPLFYMALLIHWFNPVMWISFKLMSKDQEMSCDEKVIQLMGREIRKDYSQSLLKHTIVANNIAFGAPLAFGESHVSARVKNIMGFQKRGPFTWLLFGTLIILVGVFLISNPRLERTEVNELAKGLYDHKSAFVGDASNVGNLISKLPLAEYKIGISLQTQTEPYGLTIHYQMGSAYLETQTGLISLTEADIVLTNEMMRNAATLFCLIDNVTQITMEFEIEGEVVNFTFDRENMNEVLELDIRSLAESYETFSKQFLPLLERTNWKKYVQEVYIPHKIELYVWRNKELTGTEDVYYTLLTGTNRVKDSKTIYDLTLATNNIDEVNQKLGKLIDIQWLDIRQNIELTKDEMMIIDEKIIFNGSLKSIGVFGEEFEDQAIINEQEEQGKLDESNEINGFDGPIEKLLTEMMSSPLESSNPYDYIQANVRAHEELLKMGEEALNYMLAVFEQGEAEGLKAELMMIVCRELLGENITVSDKQYNGANEWYQDYEQVKKMLLPKFQHQSNDETENLVYEAALMKYGQGSEGISLVAPKIFGTEEQGDELKIFTTIYYSTYKFNGNVLYETSGGIIPTAIIYIKNTDGTYTFKEMIEAEDGSYFKTSIVKFCEPYTEISDAIMNHYGNYEDLFVLMKQNLIQYLEENQLEGIDLKQNDGTLIPLT